MMSLWDALRMNMMISYQELVRTFLRIAITQKSTLKIGTWIAKSGPLPTAEFDNFKQVFKDGLDEVESYLLSENIV